MANKIINKWLGSESKDLFNQFSSNIPMSSTKTHPSEVKSTKTNSVKSQSEEKRKLDESCAVGLQMLRSVLKFGEKHV